MAASKSSHRTTIAGLRDRLDLSETDKRTQIRAVRAAAYAAVFPHSLVVDTKRGRATVTDFRDRPDGFQCVITIPGVKLNNPFVFVNPPLLVPDEDGDIEFVESATKLDPEKRRKYREDPEALLPIIIADAIR